MIFPNSCHAHCAGVEPVECKETYTMVIPGFTFQLVFLIHMPFHKVQKMNHQVISCRYI